MNKFYLLVISFCSLSYVVNGQITISQISNLNDFSDIFKISISNNSGYPQNNIINIIECSFDGRPVYKAQTRPINLNPGINQLSYDIIQPIQIELNELSSVPAGQKIIYDIKLIQNNQIIARERQTIILNLKEAEDGHSLSSAVKEKFAIQGNINLLGQISDRQGAGSAIPQNYLRSDGRATLSFSHIPVDLSYLLTTEQSPYRQSMNRANIRLNVPLMKQNHRKEIDERVENASKEDTAPSDSELEAFKSEMLREKFPSYQVWKSYFDTNDGKIEYKHLGDIAKSEQFENAPSTKRNFKKLQKLKVQPTLSNVEKQELEDLQSLFSEVAQLQKRNIQLKQELSRPYDELIAGYNTVQEGNKYYNELDIEDYKRVKGKFNPFSLLNKTEKVLSIFQSVSVGTSAPYFSKMTLSGLMVNGLQFEITPGKFYFSGVYGRSARESYNTQFSLPDLTLSQNTIGIKLGYGKASDTHLHLSVVQISDNDSARLLSSDLTSESNRILAAEGMISLFNNSLSLEGELVGSLLTRDSKAVSLDNELRSSVPLSFLYPETNSTSSFAHAFRLSGKYNANKIGVNISGDIERLNPNFRSLGAPTLLSNVLRWKVSGRKSFFSNKVQLGLNAGRDNNSLNPLLQDVNNTTESYGVDITLTFPNLPQISGSYAPFAQNSTINATGDNQFSKTTVTNISISYPYKFGEGFRANTQLGYYSQSLNSNIEGATSQNTTYSFNQNLNYKDFGVNASLTHAPGQQIGEVINDISTLSANATMKVKKLNSSIGLQLFRVPNQDMKTGYLATASYSLTDKIVFDVRAQRNIYTNVIGANSFNEYYIQSGLRINFGGKKEKDKIKYEEKPQPVNRDLSLSEVNNDEKPADQNILSKQGAERSQEQNITQISTKDEKVSLDKSVTKGLDNTLKVPDQTNEIAKNERADKQDNQIQKTDITVTSRSHHYKILFAIENTPDKLYMSLADVGPVSSEQANGNNYMYYIGFYSTKERADEALQKVKGKGFTAARVMEFNKGALEKEFIETKEQPSVTEILDKETKKVAPPVETSQPTEPIVEKPKSDKKPIEQIQEVIKSNVVSYHILFRVLDNPYEKFDNLKQFGPLYRETFDDKGNSRYLIGNTDDIKEAKKLLDNVKKAGYPASKVAEYVNGQLSRIVD